MAGRAAGGPGTPPRSKNGGGATSQAAGKAHVRVGLNTEGARLIDCDIIPQEKWGKPHSANHLNLDLPSPLETSKQEKACGGGPSRGNLTP